ncbi:MAG TPA: AraC family transcriptional regulator [Opitutus sp.]|nr:AraC family transcriptional regulator [Opitutus sp.]
MSHRPDPTIKTRLLLRPVKSSIGTIRLGGINQGGFGIGRPPDRRRKLTCYGFTYIMNGTGVYSDASTPETPVSKGDLVIFFPSRPHQCCTRPGEFWDELWFECEGPAFDLMRQTGMITPKRPLHHTQDSDFWFRRFFQIIPPLHLREKTPPEVIVTRFFAVVTELLAGNESAEEAPAPAGEGWLTDACELLGTHEGVSGLEPEVVARRLGFSYESFRKKFRDAVGIAPGRFHLDSRIDRAAALLHQGRLTIKEIAAQLEFCDEFYFSRCFKRRFGQSPRAFRRRVRGTA